MVPTDTPPPPFPGRTGGTPAAFPPAMVIRFEPGTYAGVATDAPLTPTKLTPSPADAPLQISYAGVTASTVLKAPTIEELSSQVGPDQVRLSNPTDAEAQAKLQAALKEAIERGTELALNPNGVTGTSGPNNAGKAKVGLRSGALKSKADPPTSTKSLPILDAKTAADQTHQPPGAEQRDGFKDAKDAALEDMYLKILAHQRQNERREQLGDSRKATLKG